MTALEPKDYILGVGVIVTLVLGVWNAVVNHRSSRRTTFINLVQALEDLTRTTQLLLKEELEKVKRESKHGDVSGRRGA